MSIADVTSRIEQIQARFSPESPTASPLGAAAFAEQLRAATSAAPATSLGSTPGTRATPSIGGAAGVTGRSVVADARRYLGIPYVWGGTDPAKGLDCSGLVQLVYRDLGYTLPRGAADQAKQGTPVARLADARPGDLIAYGTPVHHIAIYLGDGKVIEAPHSGANVRVSTVYEKPSAIRRIVPDVPSGTGGLALLLQRAQAGLPLDATALSALHAESRSR